MAVRLRDPRTCRYAVPAASIATPSTSASNWRAAGGTARRTAAAAGPRGSCGTPPVKTRSTSSRHSVSAAAARAGSVSRSTASSTARQKSNTAVIARRFGRGQRQKRVVETGLARHDLSDRPRAGRRTPARDAPAQCGRHRASRARADGERRRNGAPRACRGCERRRARSRAVRSAGGPRRRRRSGRPSANRLRACARAASRSAACQAGVHCTGRQASSIGLAGGTQSRAARTAGPVAQSTARSCQKLVSCSAVQIASDCRSRPQRHGSRRRAAPGGRRDCADRRQ